AAVLATGNDTRAIEAGAHAYAVKNGKYTSLTHYELGENNSIIGTIELPLAIGLVGGATKSHAVARMGTKILKVESASELSGIIASLGLAQNFAGLRALASEGIQKGHMKLHIKNMAVQAGAESDQVDEIVKLAINEEKYRFDDIKRYLEIVNN